MSFSAMRRRAVHAVRNYLHRDWNVEDMLNFDEISPFIRLHLTHFYFSLMCVTASSAVGSCFHPTGNIERLVALFAACVSFICFHLTAPWNKSKRLCLLMLGACFGWAAVTPWFSWLFGVDTGFVASIILANCVAFACFWTSSKWTSVFEVVYFQALVLCFLLVMACLCFTSNVFGGDSAEWKYPLYSFLLWWMAYMAGYSQEVVVKARRGDEDHVKHAVCLFTDFPAFVIHLTKELWRLWRD